MNLGPQTRHRRASEIKTRPRAGSAAGNFGVRTNPKGPLLETYLPIPCGAAPALIEALFFGFLRELVAPSQRFAIGWGMR